MVGLDQYLDPSFDYTRDPAMLFNPMMQAPAPAATTDMLGSVMQLLGSRGGGGGRRGGPLPQGSGDVEIFFGGNKFNPSSVDSTHMGHLHFGDPDLAGDELTRVLRRIERMGFDVGENPHFGGVAPVHTKNSLHYLKGGGAGDINYNGDVLHGAARRRLGKTASEDKALGFLEHWLMRRFG